MTTIRPVLERISSQEGAEPRFDPNNRPDWGRRPDPRLKAVEDALPQPQPEPIETPPLEEIAIWFLSLKYGEMMQLSRELKNVPNASFDTPESIAALLHTWATYLGKPPVATVATPEVKSPTADTMPKPTPIDPPIVS